LNLKILKRRAEMLDAVSTGLHPSAVMHAIVDAPYVIDAYNQDNYPPMNPWIPVEREVGVKIGDWVKYGNFDVAWSSNDPEARIPVGLSILNETEWLLVSVEAISGMLKFVLQQYSFKKGLWDYICQSGQNTSNTQEILGFKLTLKPHVP